MQIKQMLTQKKCYVGQNKPEWIIIHETDNTSKGAGAKTHARAMNNGNLAGTVHYYVDDKEIYQTLRHSDGGYSIGTNYGHSSVNWKANNKNVISIEICVNPDSDYEKARLNAVWLAKQLMRQYKWDSGHVIRHYDAKGKYCPRKMMDKPELWEDFKRRLNEESEDEEMIREEFEAYKAKTDGIINTMGQEIARLKQANQEMVYNYIDENMPRWAHEPVKWCADNGIVQGTGDGLGLNDAKLWVCTVVYRTVRFIAKMVGCKIE